MRRQRREPGTARAAARSSPAGARASASADVTRLFHDLEIHRIELEMQNRELQDANGVLEESRARYADLYDQAPVAHLTFDVRGTILAANLSAGRLLATDAHALVGRYFRSFLSVPGRRSFDATLARSFASGEPATSRVRLAAADTQRVIEVVLAPFAPPLERISVCHAAVIDVTAPAAAEERRTTLLRRERKARASAESDAATKEQFLAIVSHELRTPLSAILMWIAVLQNSKAGRQMRAQALRGIAASAYEQVRLVDDLLDTARATYGKLQIDRAPVDLAALTDDVVAQMSVAAASRQVRVRHVRAPDACLVLGDAGRLRQVLGNLLANALKFSPTGSAIEVSSRAIAARVVVSVRDQGEGIASDLLPFVFEPFRQRESQEAFRRSGLGLGLFIAGKLVALHDGTISAESPGPGQGATFTIAFPRLSLPAEDATPRRAERDPVGVRGLGDERPLAGLSILLVDDHAPTRRALASALQQRGAEMTAADSAASARVALARVRPAVVISDLTMPGEDGYAFMRKVRAAQPANASGARVAALALSANAASRSRARALHAGFDRFLAKPVDISTLVSVVVELAGRAEATPARTSNRSP